MSENSIRCIDCNWERNPEELLSETESLDDRFFLLLPNMQWKKD